MRPASILANLFVLLTFGVAALLHTYNEPLYYLAVQEDQYLEWATFWGFIVAGGIYVSSAWQQLRARVSEYLSIRVGGGARRRGSARR